MASRKRAVRTSGAGNEISECPAGDGYHYLPWVDCICAGVPCQDVSVAGKRAGIKGERTGLVYEFARILRELRPTWFVFENVPGLLSSNDGRDFAEVLRLFMVECGYGVSWRVLDSQFFGVAQRRSRLFVVGYFGKPCPAAILFEPESLPGSAAPRREARTDVAIPLTSGTGLCGKPSGRRMEDDFNLVAAPITASYGKQPDSSDRNGGPPNVLLVSAAPDTYGVRDFTGLPAGMDSPRYRALGNAVTVPVMHWIGKRIIAAEKSPIEPEAH